MDEYKVVCRYIYIWKDRLNKITIRKDIYHLRQE